MRKINSTNSINEQFLVQACSLNSALNIISGRWKCQIISTIFKGNNRFHLLKKELPNISEQVLGRQLKELESHSIVVKITIPVGIKYILTNKGNDLIPILQSLCKWDKTYSEGKEILVSLH